MPTAKTAADAAGSKKKKSSKDKDTKDKKDKSSSRSKEKSESKKKRSSEETDKTKAAKPSAESAPQPQQPPQQYDPDAVQLFRRYDRARTGVLLRRDFLQLLRDYAQPPSAGYPQAPHRFLSPRQPLSLTDSQGIPLGYERSDKNSEFEAGQLFERYDRDHAGALSMDKFHVFFNDFRVQLRGFVDDLSYAASVSGSAVIKRDASPSSRDGGETETRPPKPALAAVEAAKPVTSVRASYQATLWELRKLCKDELQGQRERILHAMDRLRARMASPRRSLTSSSHDDPFAFRPSRMHSSVWDNQIVDRYDALESDGERVDEILRLTRRQLRKGMDVTTKEMEAFLERAPELMADARELAMKVYDSYGVSTQQPRRETSRDRSPSREEKEGASADAKEKSAKPPPTPTRSMDEMQKTLRVKDQIIYQLLQERTTLRRQKSVAETDLQELTELSTHEMRKWARLTDDMQAEIARLRDRLDEVEGR